jgi:hypothetical protein
VISSILRILPSVAAHRPPSILVSFPEEQQGTSNSSAPSSRRDVRMSSMSIDPDGRQEPDWISIHRRFLGPRNGSAHCSFGA